MPRLYALPVLAVLCLSAGPLHGQEPGALPINETVRGRVGEEAPRVYRFEASEPGVLSVAARSVGGHDIALDITDADGQTLPDGYGDWDIHGNVGTEQLASTLGAAGEYRVYVSVYEASAEFVIGATFLAMPAAALPEDPNGRPGDAIELRPNAGQVGGSVRPTRGDHRDWYRLTPEKDCVLTVYTRSADDLILEAFVEGQYFEPVAMSDSDDQNAMGNESLTLDARAGETMYFRVSTYSDSADYVIAAGVIVTESAPAE